jgi:hypothetical protein
MSVKTSLDFLKISKLETMEAKSSINLSIEGTAKEKGYFEDNITIIYTENGTKEKLEIPLRVYVFSLNASKEIIEKSLSCFELAGELCNADEICETPVSASDGSCCKSCKKTKSESSGGFVAGLIILVLLGVIGFVLYKKFKDVKPKNKLLTS